MLTKFCLPGTNTSINFPNFVHQKQENLRSPLLIWSFPSYLVSKRVLVQNLSYEIVFVLHENEPEGGTHFHEWFRTSFDTEKKKQTWEWLIFPCILFSFISILIYLRLDSSDRKLKLKRTINSQEGALKFKLPSWKSPKPLRPLGRIKCISDTFFTSVEKKSSFILHYIHTRVISSDWWKGTTWVYEPNRH